MDDGNLAIGDLEADTVTIKNKYGRCGLGTVTGKNIKVKMADGDFIIEKGDIADLNVRNEYGLVRLGLILDLDSYDLDLETEHGNVEAPGYPEISVGGKGSKRLKSNNGAEDKVKVNCDVGDIIITAVK